MKSFEAGYLKRLPISHGVLRTVRLLGEARGKEELFRAQFPQALETLRQVAIIQSTESSNRIEGVTAPMRRIEALIAQKTRPKNRSEQEIAGYRDALKTIHANHASMTFTPASVLKLHRELLRYVGGEGGHWKRTDNQIVEVFANGARSVRFKPVPARATPAQMARLHELFGEHWQADEVEKLLLIPAYILDFLCIHPFPDGNGRMARLLSLLLLYRAGFEVGRFISLERIIEESKESYYETLYQCSRGWNQGKHRMEPWLEYFLGVLTAAYREFEERVGTLTAARGAKTRMVLDAIERLPERFRMAELERLCPNVTREMIRKVLGPLKKKGYLRCEGAGVSAVWLKGGTKS